MTEKFFLFLIFTLIRVATDFIHGHFWVLFPIMSYSFVGVCLSLAFLAIGFQLADTNTPLVTVIEANGDPCSSYTVGQFIHES